MAVLSNTTPALSGSPYPTIEWVMNLARVRVLDTAIDLAGELLADDATDSETLLNAGWRWCQVKCQNAGIETPINEAEVIGLPACAGLPSTQQAWINWQGSTNGVSNLAVPALPFDLRNPLMVWRRRTASREEFCPMDQAQNGLPTSHNPMLYDWRDDGMYFHAPNYQQDLRIRYIVKRPWLNIASPQDRIPMMFCEGALSARIAYEYANKRGAAQAPAMAQLAEEEFDLLAQGTGRKNERRNLRRQRYGRASRYADYY